jgi:uncharacterized protein involved in exopolysaccharide biosynthesis
MGDNISAKDLIIRIFRWRKKFIWITIVSALISGVVAFLMPKQYKSVAIVFPARQFSVSKLVVEANAGNQEDYMMLGDADDCEKLIQILTSDALKMLVADRFNLWKRWKITDTVFAYHYLKDKWEDMVRIKRTEFNSVRVEVHDYTADSAAFVANGIVDLADTVKFRMNRAVAGPVVDITREEYELTLKRMKELEDSLNQLRRFGILHYKEQVKAYSKSYAKALEKGDQAAIKRLKGKLDTLSIYGTAYTTIKDNLDKYGAKYPDIKMKYDEALVNYRSTMPIKFVVERAIPNEFKSRPKRMVLIGISVLAANILGLFILLMRERFSWKELKEKSAA